MKGRIFAGLFLCSLFFVDGADAQSPNIPEKPVWTLEFIKVKPENFGPAMAYLEDHWMRVRAEAKRQGAVLDYHLMSNGGIVTPGHKLWDQDSIVLLTKYKNMDAFMESQKRFVLMPGPDGYFVAGPDGYFVAGPDGYFVAGPDGSLFAGPNVLRPLSPEVLFETLNGQVFVEEPETSTGFKLLTKQ